MQNEILVRVLMLSFRFKCRAAVTQLHQVFDHNLDEKNSYREELRVRRQTLLPDHQERVGQVEAEEDDPAGGRGHIGPGEEGGDEEAEHDRGHRVGHHEAEDHRRVGLGKDVAVLKTN